MRSVFFHFVALCLLAACGKDDVGVHDSHEGVDYVTSATDLAAIRGEGHALLRFTGKNEAELVVQSRFVEDVAWIAKLHVKALSKDALSLRCRETTIVGNGDRLRFEQTSRVFLEKTPKAFRECSDRRVRLERVKVGDESDLSGEGLSFTPKLSKRLMPAVDELPPPSLEYESRPTKLQDTLVFADPKNAYLPRSPQTHRFYLLPKWTLSGADLKSTRSAFEDPPARWESPALVSSSHSLDAANKKATVVALFDLAAGRGRVRQTTVLRLEAAGSEIESVRVELRP